MWAPDECIAIMRAPARGRCFWCVAATTSTRTLPPGLLTSDRLSHACTSLAGASPCGRDTRRSPNAGRLLRRSRARVCLRSSDVLAGRAVGAGGEAGAAWPGERAGPGSPAAPWAAVALRAPCGPRGRAGLSAGLAACAVARTSCAGSSGARARHERDTCREDDRPDPADLAHPASSRPFVDHPRVRPQTAEGGVRESGRST